MDSELKGALVVAALGAAGWVIRTLFARFQALKDKIAQLRADADSALNKRIDALTIQLATNSVAVTKLESKLEDFKVLTGTVDKLAKDVTALHVWRRIRFPDNGGQSEPQ